MLGSACAIATTRARKQAQKKESRRAKGSGAAYFIAERTSWVCAAELQRGADGSAVAVSFMAERERSPSGSSPI